MKKKKREELKPSRENFLELKKVVDNGGENDCRDHFLDFAEVLADHHNLELDAILFETNVSLDGKRSDIILCGSKKSDIFKSSLRPIKGTSLSASQKFLIVYECKSPKSAIFTKPNKNSSRYFPSSYLIEAETQVIEYVSYLTASRDLIKQQMNDLSYSGCDVKIGGIIIGKRYEDDQDNDAEYETASALRRKFLYEEAKINMLAWEEILLMISKKHGYSDIHREI